MPARLLRCLALLWAAWIAQPGAEPLQLYTEEYPPVSFSSHGEPDGMAVEVVRALLERLQLPATIEVVPWARGLQEVPRTPNSALFVTIRNAEREPLFKWVGPILLAQDGFYALRDSTLEVASLDDLERVGPIALPRDWFTYQELKARGLSNLLGVTEPEQMFKLLKRGRVPLIAADNLSFHTRGEAAAQVDHLRADDVRVVLPYRASFGYIAFWPGTADAEITRWQQALDAMKDDGSFARIYQRWLPGEPVPR